MSESQAGFQWEPLHSVFWERTPVPRPPSCVWSSSPGFLSLHPVWYPEAEERQVRRYRFLFCSLIDCLAPSMAVIGSSLRLKKDSCTSLSSTLTPLSFLGHLSMSTTIRKALVNTAINRPGCSKGEAEGHRRDYQLNFRQEEAVSHSGRGSALDGLRVPAPPPQSPELYRRGTEGAQIPY